MEVFQIDPSLWFVQESKLVVIENQISCFHFPHMRFKSLDGKRLIAEVADLAIKTVERSTLSANFSNFSTDR